MRKFLIVTIPCLLMACSTISRKKQLIPIELNSSIPTSQNDDNSIRMISLNQISVEVSPGYLFHDHLWAGPVLPIFPFWLTSDGRITERHLKNSEWRLWFKNNGANSIDLNLFNWTLLVNGAIHYPVKAVCNESTIKPTNDALIVSVPPKGTFCYLQFKVSDATAHRWIFQIPKMKKHGPAEQIQLTYELQEDYGYEFFHFDK